VILLEPRSEHLNNPSNLNKGHLGNKFHELAGDKFKYIMVFERNPIDGAWTVDAVKRMVGML
jgi:type III restriction enzyme